MATDPVCGMTVDEETAAGSAEYEQKRYYFCSTHCLHKFQAAPREYQLRQGLQPARSQCAGAVADAPPAGEKAADLGMGLEALKFLEG